MGRCAQMVVGPAGAGKSTFCNTMYTHLHVKKRRAHIMNLDPAAESFEYEPSIDIRELITLDTVMKEFGYGPNGGLVKCLEILLDNISWLREAMGDFEDDYLIIDCPGQIELYTHLYIMKDIISELQNMGYRICCVYMLDCNFLDDHHKFFSGVLNALSSMAQLELPHINVLSKADLIPPDVYEEKIEKYIDPSPDLLDSSEGVYNTKYHKLTRLLAKIVSEYNMVMLFPLNIKLEESIDCLLHQINTCLQCDADEEVKEPKEALDC